MIRFLGCEVTIDNKSQIATFEQAMSYCLSVHASGIHYVSVTEKCYREMRKLNALESSAKTATTSELKTA